MEFSKIPKSSISNKNCLVSQNTKLITRCSSKSSDLRCFTFRYDVYVWNANLGKFFRLNDAKTGSKCGEILSKSCGWNVDEQEKR